MVLDSVSRKERQGLVVAGIAVALVSLGAGFVGGNSLDSPTGDFAEGEASTAEVEEVANSLVDQQVSSQEQRMSSIANQSENISESDLSLSGEVDEVSESSFSSLYEVTISLSGRTVSQLGQVEDVDEEQTIYISKDGRYVFQQPTDLEAQQQPQGQNQSPQPR